jgi:hypothetical protein
MPVDKFGRTDNKVVQHIPIVTSSIGLTMAQLNNTFFTRDGSNTMTTDLNLNKHRVINSNESTSADNAVTRQYVERGDTFLKRDRSNATTGNIDMSKHRLMKLGNPTADHDAVDLKFPDRFVKQIGSSQMTGTLNMGGYSITNVAQTVSAEDLVTKSYADNVAGLTHLDTRGNKIVNLRMPTARSDSVTKGCVETMLESIFNTDFDMREHKIRNVAK